MAIIIKTNSVNINTIKDFSNVNKRIQLLSKLKSKRLELLNNINNANQNIKIKEAFSVKKKRLYSVFNRIISADNKINYHTRIFANICTFHKNRSRDNTFVIFFRNASNMDRLSSLNLYKNFKKNDKFLGMSYGFVKSPKRFLFSYTKQNETKKCFFLKAYYIKFKFKLGEIYCYVNIIHNLLNNTAKNFDLDFYRIKNLEKKVFTFYDKKFQESIFEKWYLKHKKI